MRSDPMSRATRPTEPVIAMIWAQTPERVIGRDGTMPWHVPEDLAHFRAHTHGHPVIMGRRTWESFPARFRPLPGRTNIVVSRTLTATEEAGAELRAAAGAGDGWRLTDCTLVVTLEPCPMCAGALLLARIPRVVFGAWDPKAGACGSVLDVVRDPRFNHQVQVRAGVRSEESAALLRGFFAAQRD